MHACVHVCFVVRELGFFPSAISCISYSWIGNAKHGDSGLMLEFCHTCIFIIITKPHLGFPINNFFFLYFVMPALLREEVLYDTFGFLIVAVFHGERASQQKQPKNTTHWFMERKQPMIIFQVQSCCSGLTKNNRTRVG